MANYSFKNTIDIKDEEVINSGNFTQINPNTEIMVDKTLTINGGNFTNVKKQSKWTVNGGNWTQISWCSHNHPEFIEKGLKECPVECSHMISKENIIIDGVVIDTVYTYKDTLL